MKTLLIILSLFISSQALSQKKTIEFGSVTEEELKMSGYEEDKEAKAVILYDKGKSEFINSEDGYDIRFTRHKRIKIFDKSESEHAAISIPFFVDGSGRTEEVKSIEAVTYNLKNGKLIRRELNPSTIYEEQVNDRWFVKKFVFPDVQDGSVLEYRYVLETPFYFNLPDWRFQDKIPTIYSEYQVSMIPFYEYVFFVQGISKFDYQTSVIDDTEREWGNVAESYGKNVGSGVKFKDYVHTYVLKDIPAFNDESFITSVNDYIIEMDFQLAKFHSPRGGTTSIISTWADLNESLLDHENFGKYLKKSSRQARKILKDELDLKELDENQKAKKIINYVKLNFDWNDLNAKYASQSVKDFLEKRTGNSADINLLLIALLNEADIETEPVILSSRNHGKIPANYPYDHFTNYVVALVKTDFPFLADGTEDLLPYNALPLRCLNEKGLVVNKEDQPMWLSLDSSISSLEKLVINIDVDTLTRNARTRVSVQTTNYDAFLNRSKFRNDTLEIKEFFSDKIGTVDRVMAYGFQNTSMPYSINLTGKIETEKLGNNIIIRPFLEFPLTINPLSQKQRRYPVDFTYRWERQFESTMIVPDNYKVSTLPKPYHLDNDLVQITLEYINKDGVLKAQGNYKFKKSIYAPTEYKKIKGYFDQIVELFNQPVVLQLKD